ncbi:MAG: cytochrome c maturation protein CcmE [Rhodothermaceae bacterium]|nr:cytochrome c maturation protein CcmE [Rhodothermaceae bacterium]
MKKKNIIGLVLIVGFIALAVMNFGSSVGGYMDFTQAEQTGVKAHVVGTWVENEPISYDPATNIFQFHMQDELGRVRKVHYLNPKPANFEDAEKLVIEGSVQGDVFVAEHILVKCPSKYNETNVMGDQQAGA